MPVFTLQPKIELFRIFGHPPSLALQSVRAIGLPSYRGFCWDCRYRWQAFLSRSIEPLEKLECPQCGGTNTQRLPELMTERR